MLDCKSVFRFFVVAMKNRCDEGFKVLKYSLLFLFLGVSDQF